MKKTYFTSTFFLLSFALLSCSSNNDTLDKSETKTKSDSAKFVSATKVGEQPVSDFHCDYLGQKPPGDVPVEFAPGIISTKVDDSCLEISISGKEIIFTRDGKIYSVVQNASGVCNEPTALSFSGGETSFSRDGRKIYFNSRTSFPEAKVALNVWNSQKIDDQWREPKPLGAPVNNQTVHAPSVAANGNMYASGIIRLKFLDGQYQLPEKLTPDIKGFHPFIASDESFLIFDSHPVTGGHGADLFITFQKANSTWTKPVSLGEKINTTALETNAFVTPDQKYLFFTRQFDIYWVKADFIAEMQKRSI